MSNNNHKGGIFSFRRNLRDYGELGSQLSREEKAAEVIRERGNNISSGRCRKIEDLRLRHSKLVLRMLIGSGILVAGAAGGVTGAVSLFDDDEKEIATGVNDEVLPANDLPFVQEMPAGVEIPEDVRVKNLTRIEHKETTGASYVEKGLALQKQWKALSIRAVSLFMGADPRVEQLLAFMDSNAFYSIPLNETATQQVALDDPTAMINQMQNPYGFEIVYMPEEFSQYYPASIVTQDGPTLRVIAEFKTLQWLGLMLLHELSHVEDSRVRHEDMHDKKQWLDGEVKAHSFEMNLLKFVDPNAYQFLIEKGTPLYLAGNREALVQLIEKLYRLEPTTVSEKERALFVSSCIIAIAFEDAREKGADDSRLVSVYRDVAKKYGNLDL